MSEFVVTSTPPAAAKERATQAVCDTIGVILAGVPEPAAEIARATILTVR
jgi:2-methylcitrate dehydratase PrpD